jgi:hypothetical protein
MGFAPYLGRDGMLHTFTYVKVHTARIYEVPKPRKENRPKTAR